MAHVTEEPIETIIMIRYDYMKTELIYRPRASLFHAFSSLFLLVVHSICFCFPSLSLR